MATQTPARPKREQKLREVGRSMPRLESRAKVDGSVEYIHNLRLPGMLHGKIHRSSLAHALIKNIDASKALAVEGVYAVITSKDVAKISPNPYYGPAFHDQPILAIEKVRHVGEPVAVVLASDPHVAEAASDLIEVEYEPLDPVFNEVEAAKPGAPIIHDVLKPAGTFTDLKHLAGRSGTNVALDTHVRRGDIAKGFAESEHVFEHTFHTGKVMHATFEPMVTLAELNATDGIIIHTASQSPSFVRSEVSRLLKWPENRVRVKTAYLGGGFGAKLYIKLEALVAVCALAVRKPVRIALTMEEQFVTITKHGATLRIKTGVDKDGKILAREVETFWNGGAYADIGARVTQKSGFTAAGPYDIENVSLDNHLLYTNDPPAGALRGFGISQVVWAYERQADIIARAIGVDPLEFRRRNALVDGRPHATGTIVEGMDIHGVLDQIEERMEWKKPIDRGTGTIRRGRGMAIGLKACVSPTTSAATVQIFGDGSVAVHTSTVDMGQASDTAMAQIAAEVLGIKAEQVRVVHPDTDVTPYDMATLGSRSTYHMGNAVMRAAEDAKQQLMQIAGGAFGHQIVELDCNDGVIVAPTGKTMTFRDVMLARFNMQAGTITGVGSFAPPYKSADPVTGQSPNITPFWMLGGCGVEVEVDTETGRITVTKMVNVADVGRAINPEICERQLTGAGIMQLGFTLFEEMIFNDGQVVNASLADYKIPGLLDVPIDMKGALVEAAHPNGPFGAKGTGETGVFSPAPAIANAVYDAIDIGLMDMPFTPERVLRAIKQAQGTPLGDE